MGKRVASNKNHCPRDLQWANYADNPYQFELTDFGGSNNMFKGAKGLEKLCCSLFTLHCVQIFNSLDISSVLRTS